MNINLVFLIAVCQMTMLRGSKVLVSLFALELGASPFAIGAIVAMYAALPAALALLAGKWSDRAGTRQPMLAGSVGVTCALLLPAWWPELPALYVSAVLLGGSYVFYHVSVQNLVGLLSATPAARTRNFSNYSLVLAVGGFTGPLIAGFGIEYIGHARTYLLLAALPLLPVAILAFAQNVKGSAGAAAPADRRIMDLLRNRPLRRVLIVGGVVLTGIDLFQFYMPIYAHSIGLTASTTGIIVSMFAAASFVVRLVIQGLIRRLGEDRLLAIALFVGAAAYVVTPFVTDVLMLCAVAFVFGLGLGLGQPLTMMLTFSRSPEGRSGESLGLRLTVNNITHIAVPMVFGAIGSLFGLAPVFWTNAVLLAGSGLLSRSRAS